MHLKHKIIFSITLCFPILEYIHKYLMYTDMCTTGAYVLYCQQFLIPTLLNIEFLKFCLDILDFFISRFILRAVFVL